MKYVMFMCLFLCTTESTSVFIPYVQDVIFKSLNDDQIQMFITNNTTCEQCLCDAFHTTNYSSYLALNCFPNNTCQFIASYPQTYTLSIVSGARFYFLQNRFPNASSCCMPNMTQLMDRLKNTIPIVKNLTFEPAAMDYDETNPNELGLIGRYGGWVYWLDPKTLDFVRNTSIINASLSLSVRNDFVYTAIDGQVGLNVRHRLNGSFVSTINHPLLTRIRKCMFMQNNTRMIVTAQDNQSLAVFDIHSPTNYTFRENLSFPVPITQGLVRVNDTFFYASAWTNRSVFAYKYENLSWSSQALVYAVGSSTASHLTVDECGRVWLIINNYGLRIYDSNGTELANWNIPLGSGTIFDILLLPNYVLYLTLRQAKQIIRYDPQVFCS